MTDHPIKPDAANDYDETSGRHAPVGRIFSLFSPHRVGLGLILALIVCAGVAGAIAPFAIRAIVDQAFPQGDFRLLGILCAALLGIALLSAAAGVVQVYLATRIGQNIMHELRVRLYEHLQSLSLAFFSSARTGDVQARISSDIAGMQSLLTNTATDIARNVSVVATTIIAMILLDWRLALASLAMMPFLLWLNNRVAALREKITFAQQERIADMSATVTESLSAGGFILSRTMGRARHLVKHFHEISADVARLEVRSHTAGQWEYAIIFFVLDILPALTFFAGGLFMAQGAGVSIGTLVALIALQEQLLWPLLELFEARVEFAKGRALLTRVFQYFDTPPTITESPNAVKVSASEFKGEIVFSGVFFSYQRGATATLHDINLTIAGGRHTAIVGATGSGKTTLGYLIARLYDVDEGRIIFDGVDIRDMSFTSLSNLLGVVTQDPFLLNASIKENLLFAKPEASDAEIGNVLRLAQLTEVIERLPDGLDAMVGERGYQFSGGERQRLSLARTLLRDPPMLLLDEATSALDTQTERALSAALASTGKPRTVISIAHRLATIRNADRIVVLDRGRIVETGTHDELLVLGGAYARLAVANSFGPAETASPTAPAFGQEPK